MQPSSNWKKVWSAVLASFHWLPIFVRTDFKILFLVFKVLNGLAWPYLTELLHHHIPVWALMLTYQMLIKKTIKLLLKTHLFSLTFSSSRTWHHDFIFYCAATLLLLLCWLFSKRITAPFPDIFDFCRTFWDFIDSNLTLIKKNSKVEAIETN